MEITVWARLGAAVRWLLGALTLVGGLTWMLLNLHGPNPPLDMVVGAVLAAGGLVLLMPHRIRLPALATAAAATGVAVVGTVAGLAATSSHTCCMYAHVQDRGLPFTWMQRGAAAGDPDTARRLAESSSWQLGVPSLAANLLFWAYVGMLVVVTAGLVRRTAQARREARVPAGSS